MQTAYILAPRPDRVDALMEALDDLGLGSRDVRQIAESPAVARRVALPEATLEQRTDLTHSRLRTTGWGLVTGIVIGWALSVALGWSMEPALLTGAALGGSLGLLMGVIVGVSASHPVVETLQGRLDRGEVLLVISADRERLGAVAPALRRIEPDIEVLEADQDPPPSQT